MTVQIKIVAVVVFSPIFAQSDLFTGWWTACLGCKPQTLQVQEP